MDFKITPLASLLKFPFEDEDWQTTFLIGSALIFVSFFIPILPLIFVAGYGMEVMRQAVRGEKLSLPKWDDWGRLFKDGLHALVISLVYAGPSVLIFILGFGFYFAVSFLAPFMLESGAGEGIFVALLLFSMFVMFLSIFLSLLLFTVGGLPLPVAMAHAVRRDELKAAFRFREWWPILKANKWAYFVAWTVALGIFVILYLVYLLPIYTLVCCFITPFLMAPLLFYTMLASNAVFGQIYYENSATLDLPLESF